MKDKKGIVLLLFFGVLMGALDVAIVGPSLSSIEKSLHIIPSLVGWTVSIYVLFNLMGISLFARLSDVFGRRNIYISAITIFAFGSLWVAFASSFEQLLIGRAIQGFGASGIFPVASALVGDLFPPEKRGQILGMIGAVFGVAFMIGPIFAGVMLHFFPWNYMFTINIPFAALLIFFSYKLLPSHKSETVIKIDWGGIVSLGVALGMLAYAISNIKMTGVNFDIAHVIAPLVIALISVAFLVRIETRTESPILKFSLFKNKNIVIAVLIATVTGIIEVSFMFLPKFLASTFQLNPSKASFMLVPIVLATAVGSPIFGKLIDKLGIKPIVITGLSLCLVGFITLYKSSASIYIFIIGGIITGLGLSVILGSSLRYIVLNNTDTADRATSQGLLTIFSSLGRLTGSSIVSALMASYLADNIYSKLFIGIAIALAIMVTVSFQLENQKFNKHTPENI
jgi:EmrB/QacA subfamily drug resistance transporter